MAEKRQRRRWHPAVWFGLGALTVIVLAVAAGLFLVRPNAQGPVTETRVVSVTVSTEQSSISVGGTLAPRDRADLNFSSPGTVTSVAVQVGQKVGKGALLARIDDSQLRDAVELARAGLNAAQASLNEARDAKASSSQIASARAQVNSASARLRSAQGDLADASLTSPIAGVVASVDISAGDQVGSGASAVQTGSAAGAASGLAGVGSASTGSTAQVVVISPDAWLVEATVGSADVASLKRGQPVQVSLDGTSTTASGTVDSVGIVASTTGGSTVFPVVIRLTDNPAGLYDGANATASVITETLADVLSVPTAAVTNRDGRHSVQKMVGGQPTRTDVTVGRVFGDRTQILTGLAAGDEVQISYTYTPPPGQGGIFRRPSGVPTGPPAAAGGPNPRPTR